MPASKEPKINLTALRNYLKKTVAVTGEDGNEQETAIINQLIPAMIDSLTDEELLAMFYESFNDKLLEK